MRSGLTGPSTTRPNDAGFELEASPNPASVELGMAQTASDDYLVKRFSIDELRALLRQAGAEGSEPLRLVDLVLGTRARIHRGSVGWN
jgi:hypothetical protein